MRKNKSVFLSVPYILWMVAFTLIPLCVVGYYALTDPDTGAFTLDNIRDLGMYLPVLGQSVLYSLISAALCLLLGTRWRTILPTVHRLCRRSCICW